MKLMADLVVGILDSKHLSRFHLADLGVLQHYGCA